MQGSPESMLDALAALGTDRKADPRLGGDAGAIRDIKAEVDKGTPLTSEQQSIVSAVAAKLNLKGSTDDMLNAMADMTDPAKQGSPNLRLPGSLQLTDLEKAADEANRESQLLESTETKAKGSEMNYLNKYNEWVKMAGQMPLTAGWSGTTMRLIQAAQQLGVGDAVGVRQLAMGALIVPDHHSYLEIAQGAAGAVPFTHNDDAEWRDYHEIVPYGEALGRSAGGGKFPEEV
jgi:hypothetical protein